jgi:hypothetical protein
MAAQIQEFSTVAKGIRVDENFAIGKRVKVEQEAS